MMFDLIPFSNYYSDLPVLSTSCYSQQAHGVGASRVYGTAADYNSAKVDRGLCEET